MSSELKDNVVFLGIVVLIGSVAGALALAVYWAITEGSYS